MPNVSFVHPELAAVLPSYRVITDCLIGQEAVKKAGAKYLPRPNPTDVSKENVARYEDYLKRALFYNVTLRTLNGMVGQVFARDPVSEIPNSMDIIEKDATGNGVTLIQQAKRLLNLTISKSRAGLFVDYPNTGGVGVTAKDLADGLMHPTLTVFPPEIVINWAEKTRKAKKILCMVVIAERWEYYNDGFESKYGCQFRVLQLTDADVYQVTVWQENNPTNWDGVKIPTGKNFVPKEQFIPTDASGKPFNEIPFVFVGAENNDPSVDNPALVHMANINIAHYRNSADYEEAAYVMGQPTYWFSGLTEDWVKTVMKGQVNLGSWGGVMLPSGGAAGLLQAEANTMAFEAMTHKEQQMIAIGAKLVASVGVEKTATEDNNDEAAESSFLSSAAKNVSAAIEWALVWCGKFMGAPEQEMLYTLNTDFDLSRMTPEQRLETVKEWQAGALTFTEMRTVLRKAGIATEDDDKAMTMIADEQAAALAAAVDEAGQMADATGANVGTPGAPAAKKPAATKPQSKVSK